MSHQLCFFKPPAEYFQPLFTIIDNCLEKEISFRSLNLSSDLETIHSWITQPYTAKFWQMNVDRSELHNIYQSILCNPLAHSFIGTLDDRTVCQIDLYHVSAEEIKEHVAAGPGDCGLHILMLPPRESAKGLTEAMLRAFTGFYFSHVEAKTLYGEPDIANHWGNLAAKRSGFHFQKTITLSYKTANLYSITKTQFHEQNSKF